MPNGQKVANSLAAADAVFRFNGQDQVGFNTELLASCFGKRFTYNGSKRVNSGLPLAAAPKSMTVKFSKKGKYTYLRDIHPGMEGQVVVKGKRASVPTANQDKRRLKKQIATALKRAKKLPSMTPPANTVYTRGSAKGGGNGFWNSGIMDQSSQSAQLPSSSVVTFGAAGTFDYYRAIHPFVQGRVVVTP